MSHRLPFTEIAGEKLNSEQTSYLEGLFAGLRNRGLTFEDVEINPAAAVSRTPLDSLIFEERVKRELHPLDAYPVLLEHAAANKAPDRENIFRFKWNGLFFLTPHHESFMCRLRIPGGVLKSFQLRELARIAQELTTGYVQVTTRSNLQMRYIQPKDAPELVSRIEGVGLHTRGAGADNIRNLTCNPTAGLDPEELIDTLPLCQKLGRLIINDRAFYDMPRKFNIAIDGGGSITAVEDTNDIGFKAVRVGDEAAPLTPGVYFRVAVGGATGHKAFARDLGVLVVPDDVPTVAAAMVRVYIANGNRGDRKKARLKHLFESWSLDKFLDETEKLLGRKLARLPLPTGAGLASRETAGDLRRHLGAHQQKQPGLNWVGAAVPVGQLTPRQMLRLAELSDLYGSGEIRLTIWQNLILPNIPDGAVESVKKALVKMGLHWQVSPLRQGLVACTGNSHCKFAASNTKAHALELADYLDKKTPLDQPINIHLTGCPNSCAQHYMGDIGLLGTKVKVAGESVEGYHVFVGGGFGPQQGVGRQVFQNISFNDLKPTLERMLKGYLRHRQDKESFQSFARRHDLNKLQAIFSNNE